MIPLFRRPRIMFADEILAVLREGDLVDGGVIYEDGKPKKVAPRGFSILANVQALRGDDLLRRPEADRYSDGLKIFTPKLPGRAYLDTNDKVKRGSTLYQAQVCDDWGSYIEAQIIGVDVPDDAIGRFLPIDTSLALLQKPMFRCAL